MSSSMTSKNRELSAPPACLNKLLPVLAWFSVLLTWSRITRGLDNSLARTPPLGWMSWGYYECGVQCEEHPNKCLNEKLIMSVADVMWSEGYADAGYEYVVVDDCWAERLRDRSGELVADKRRFPRGIKALADYVHSRGLKFGLYGAVGERTCEQYPGSRRHLRRDAETFASWGVDYVKMDGCFVGEKLLNAAYTEFGEYLKQTGRPVVYSCSWPYYIQFVIHKQPDFAKVSQTCNLWRNYHDIKPSWLNVLDIIRYFQKEHFRTANFTGPGRWNDPDMILVGRGVLTPGQSRVQLAVWAMLSAPLLLSCDMLAVKKWEKELLINPYLLAIDQDPLGIQAVPHTDLEDDVTIWIKKQLPMKADKFHSYSLAFVNLRPSPSYAGATPRHYALDNPDGYTVMDIFAGEMLQNVSLDETLRVNIPPWGFACIKIHPAEISDKTKYLAFTLRPIN